VMAVWEDVVTVGLVGTNRRPVPDQLPPTWGTERNHGMDPAHVVLSLAARHRAVTRAGGLLASCPPAPLGPRDRQPVASRAAHEILDRLLSPPQLELLNLWLIAAVQHGQLVSSSYWTPLALVAARSPAVDRSAACGLWHRIRSGLGYPAVSGPTCTMIFCRIRTRRRLWSARMRYVLIRS
jgi:hypothetical protein